MRLSFRDVYSGRGAGSNWNDWSAARASQENTRLFCTRLPAPGTRRNRRQVRRMCFYLIDLFIADHLRNFVGGVLDKIFNCNVFKWVQKPVSPSTNRENNFTNKRTSTKDNQRLPRDKPINNHRTSQTIDVNYKTIHFRIPGNSSSIDMWHKHNITLNGTAKYFHLNRKSFFICGMSERFIRLLIFMKGTEVNVNRGTYKGWNLSIFEP